MAGAQPKSFYLITKKEAALDCQSGADLKSDNEMRSPHPLLGHHHMDAGKGLGKRDSEEIRVARATQI